MSAVTLKDQWQLALAAACDRRLARLDLSVLIVVIDRFYRAKGNSRASSRYLSKAIGARRAHIMDSLRKLLALGYLEQTRKGHGTRATEYRPHFELASGPLEESTTDAEASGPLQESTSGPLEESTTGASGPLQESKTYLLLPAYKAGGQVSRTNTRGAALPPPSYGPEGPTTAETPRDPMKKGFDELWEAYGLRHDRQKAKAAYQKLDPDETLHAQMTAAAQTWAAAYESNGTEPRWRVRLHNWISGENWLADPPLAYEDPKSAAIANTRGSGKRAAKSKGKAGRIPNGYYSARIVRCELDHGQFGGEGKVIIETEITDGEYAGIRVYDELKFGTAYTPEEQYIARTAIANLEKLIDGPYKDFKHVVGKNVVLGSEPDGYTYDRAAPALRVVS